MFLEMLSAIEIILILFSCFLVWYIFLHEPSSQGYMREPRRDEDDEIEDKEALASEKYIQSIEEARSDYKEGKVKPLEET